MRALQPLAARCECAPHASHAPRYHAAPLPHAPRAALRLAPRRRARQLAFTPCAALPEALALIADAAASSTSAASATSALPHVYEPPVVEPWQLWVGFVAGMAPFVIAGALTPQQAAQHRSHNPLRASSAA